MAKITVVGLKELQVALKPNVKMNDVKSVVEKNGREMQDKIQRNADFKMGYQTGETKRSVGLEMKDNGLTAESGAKTEYAEYLEYGTRFMDAQPFIKPAFDEQVKRFEADMKKLTK